MASRTIKSSSSANSGTKKTNSSSRTTTTKYSSRTPSSRSPIGSSANNYDDTSKARLEAERQKRIKENKEYIAEIDATNGEIKEVRDMIAAAQEMLYNAVGGEKYKEYSRYLTEQDENLKQMSNELNASGEKAAANIRTDGEACSFNKVNTDQNKNNINSNKRTLSVNTNELKNLERFLDGINKKTKEIDSKMPKYSNSSDKLGINNSKNIQDNSQKVVKDAAELKNKVAQQIHDTERTERENLNVVERIAGWFGNLLKTPDKEQNSGTGTTVSTKTPTRTTVPSKTTTRSTTKDTRTPTNSRTPKNPKTPKNPRTRTEDINVEEAKARAEIYKLAREYGIPTSGKSDREILEAIAIKLGIKTESDSSKKNSRLWRYTMD